MKRIVTLATMAAAVVLTCGQANASIRITEWMYSGNPGEYVELTNIGLAPIDMTGWSYDDIDDVAGTTSLSAFGIVLPGETVLFTEASEALFRAAWSLPTTINVIGGNTNNLGRADQINIYDAGNVLVDRLTFGDEVFPGTIRTQNRSGNPLTPAALGADDVSQWLLSTAGDAYGSYTSTANTVGNPGVGSVPEPASVALAAVAGVAILAIRRRK